MQSSDQTNSNGDNSGLANTHTIHEGESVEPDRVDTSYGAEEEEKWRDTARDNCVFKLLLLQCVNEKYIMHLGHL